MNDKHVPQNLEIENPTPEQARKELEDYIKHVLEHDPKDMQFALFSAGHADHTCTMISGPPAQLAAELLRLIRLVTSRQPQFIGVFMVHMLMDLQALNPTGPKTSKDEIIRIVDNFLKKFEVSSPGGLH